MALANIKVITDYLRAPGQTLKAWQADWNTLSDADKDDIRMGLGDGTLTYPARKKS